MGKKVKIREDEEQHRNNVIKYGSYFIAGFLIIIALWADVKFIYRIIVIAGGIIILFLAQYFLHSIGKKK